MGGWKRVTRQATSKGQARICCRRDKAPIVAELVNQGRVWRAPQSNFVLPPASSSLPGLCSRLDTVLSICSYELWGMFALFLTRLSP